MPETRILVALAVTTAGLVLAGACGNAGGTGSTDQVPQATGDPVSAQPTSLGTILVDGQGLTVYVFANDKPNVSTCDGVCAEDWPPVPAPSTLPPSPPGVEGVLGETTRSDGSHQLTVAGHPVYRFSGDRAAGQTNGQGLTIDGGLWTVVSPLGAPDLKPTGDATPASGPGY